MIYFSIALVVAALLLAFVHTRESRGRAVKSAAFWSILAIVVLASIATTV